MNYRVILCLMFVCCLSCPETIALQWEEEKGDHFIVYHVNNARFAGKIIRRAEKCYDRIASDLGYPRHTNFWQWDDRVKIYVYPTEGEFQQAMGYPHWSKGIANYTKKEIVTYAWSQGFLDALLPHEIAHLIFRDFVGFEGEVPLWLDEGVAQWAEQKKRALAKEAALFLIRNHQYFSLDELTTLDVRGSSDNERVHYFYMQSVSLVDFMIRKYGPRSFTEFCRQLRDGKTLNGALRHAYPPSLGDLQKLEERWIKDVLGT